MPRKLPPETLVELLAAWRAANPGLDPAGARAALLALGYRHPLPEVRRAWGGEPPEDPRRPDWRALPLTPRERAFFERLEAERAGGREAEPGAPARRASGRRRGARAPGGAARPGPSSAPR